MPGECAPHPQQRVTSAAASAQRGATLVARTLVELGVKTIFCYPGGANLELLDALSRVEMEILRTEHEQGAVFAAQGYARASGRLGVCLATSGPGATNLVTGVADAASDSVPILCLTGNVATRWLGRNAFQEVDIVAITRPITKLARQIRSTAEIVPSLREGILLALRGRPGPVLIDIPKDIQQGLCETPQSYPWDDDEVAVTAVPDAVADTKYAEIASLLSTAKRPVIYAGGGIISSEQRDALTRLAETLRCPVALTLMGLGAMDPSHALCLGPLGMHGAWCANVAVNEADVVLALGVRFDDRVIGNPSSFAATAKIVHIDIDPREFNKNVVIDVALHADLRDALPRLLQLARPLPTERWRDYLAEKAAERPLQAGSNAVRLSGAKVIAMLSAKLPDDSIVTTGVGQHQMWAMQHLQPRRARGFLSSSGFGTMGFGLPAAIGAKRAVPSATVVDIDGDGSLNMTINELSTCRRYGIGVKVLVVNNQWLGMVRQWQDLIYAGNRVASSLQDPQIAAPSAGRAAPYPDFLAIAGGYGIVAKRVDREQQLAGALEEFLSDPQEPYLLDVIVEREADVLPMIPAGKSYRDVIFAAAQGAVGDT